MVDTGLTASTRADRRAARSPIAMLTHSYFDEDPRVRREARSVVDSGRPVDVYALRRPEDSPDATIDGVRVIRLNVQRHQGAGIPTYLGEYVSFGIRAAWALARAHRRRRYAMVQVHTPPDFLVVAALPLRVLGVPVLLDFHEAMPEFFRSRFPRASNPFVFRLLLLQERMSIALSSHALTVNQALLARLSSIGVAPGRASVVPNSPSLARFSPSAHPDRSYAADGVLRLVYAGALTPTYELDVALRAIARLRAIRPERIVHAELYGRGDSEASLRELAAELGIADRITFHGRIPLDAVPEAIAGADIGLAPTRRDPFTDVSLSTKIFEYAAMGKPAVCSRLPLVESTFPPGTVETYDPGDPDDLAAAILRIDDEPERRRASVAAAMDVVAQHSWEEAARAYLAIVDGLAGAPAP